MDDAEKSSQHAQDNHYRGVHSKEHGSEEMIRRFLLALDSISSNGIPLCSSIQN
jgi:hypothetical protein